MKNVFKPYRAYKSILSLTPELLHKEGVTALILDVDNTLTTHDNPVPAKGIPEWVESVKEAGIKLMIVSNNHEDRVKPFADELGIDFVCEGAKPLNKGYKEAVKKLGVPKNEIWAVGDQIFTDVMGANTSGIKVIYVEPMEFEKGKFFKVKRFIEKPLRPKNLE